MGSSLAWRAPPVTRMGFLNGLLGLRAPAPATPAPSQKGEEQGLFVHIGPDDGITAEELQTHDLATIEDRLSEILEDQGLGTVDGNNIGMDGTATLYLYGPDAERMFRAVEPALRDYPLTRRARVEIRAGGLGAPSRAVRL